jgi:hypothetical protein
MVRRTTHWLHQRGQQHHTTLATPAGAAAPHCTGSTSRGCTSIAYWPHQQGQQQCNGGGSSDTVQQWGQQQCGSEGSDSNNINTLYSVLLLAIYILFLTTLESIVATSTKSKLKQKT